MAATKPPANVIIWGRGGAVAIFNELSKHGKDEGIEGAVTSLQKLPENGRNGGKRRDYCDL